MSDAEKQVNEEVAPVTTEAQPAQRTVTAQAALLSAVELAQSRGAYRVNEMSLITEAHRIVTGQENAKLQAAAPSEDESKETAEASSE